MHAIGGGAPKHINRLAREKSPYLLQHQHNPVNWFPWGDEAFAKARQENKPILLSIGYSTCHWCHVMERESFEDEKTAEFMNRRFISIKVDREERPDIDKIYMTAVQAMGEGGGWPLNVFLTPDLNPFFGGTYFPPEPRYGRPSFLQLLEHIDQLWATRGSEVVQSAGQMHAQLARIVSAEAAPGLSLTPALLRNAAEKYKKEYEPRHGGFGRAPKFPRPSQPLFLLNYGKKYGDQEAIQMVLHTCEAMARGGIYDQIGGGFSRYSVDAEWLVPHFEKMLYDNAQLLHLYLDAYLISGKTGFAEVAHDLLRYILRDMTHPEGGFYSAEDADSEGKEGKFYTWTKKEMEELLSPGEAEVAIRCYGVTEHGNFVDHSDPNPLPKQNVLSLAVLPANEREHELLKSAREKLFQARAKRVRPHLDDKILASWNGMMLGAIARAYAVLQEENYRSAAEKNLQFLKSELWDPRTSTLYHRWREGERDSVQLLDGYANLLWGVVELYQATLNPEQLAFAVELADAMLSRFYDQEAGGFWQSAEGAKDLILRIKEDYDGAEPSGNSVAVLGLLKLSAICDRCDYREAAEKTLLLFGNQMQQLPQAVPFLMQNLQFFLEEPKRVVISGNVSSSQAVQLLRAAHAVFVPHRVILGTEGPVEPFAKGLPSHEVRAYVCSGTFCHPATTLSEKVREYLLQDEA